MSRSLLCETVTGETMAELVVARDAAAEVDLVELRLDRVRDVDVARALHGRRQPAIVTCRPVWEGGGFHGSEDARLRVLAEALERGAEYVDVEWRALRDASGTFGDLLRAGGSRIVVSSHDFDGMPGDLVSRAQSMRDMGARTVKIAATPARLTDTLVLRDIARQNDAVVIGMGAAGISTRLLATRFGSRWTYGGNAVAPGQIPTTRMLRQFTFKSIDDNTQLYGVVGQDALQAIAPVMHNAAFAASGLNAVCVPLLAADLGDFIDYAEALGFVGASLDESLVTDAVTMPFSGDAEARRAGYANTLRWVGGGWESTIIGSRGRDKTMRSGEDEVERLIGCAEHQFEWWTGRQPAAGVMRAAALAETGHRDAEAQST